MGSFKLSAVQNIITPKIINSPSNTLQNLRDPGIEILLEFIHNPRYNLRCHCHRGIFQVFCFGTGFRVVQGQILMLLGCIRGIIHDLDGVGVVIYRLDRSRFLQMHRLPRHLRFRCLIEVAISASFHWIVTGLSPIARGRKRLRGLPRRISEKRTLNILVFYGGMYEYEFDKSARKKEGLGKKINSRSSGTGR